MLFYLATLQSIPTDVYEAAAVDGTSAWRTFWRITFPLLKPAHFFVLVVFGIGALKVFDQAFIVSNGKGGPAYSTMTAVLYIYRKAFHDLHFGIAAAAGSCCSSPSSSLTLLARDGRARRRRVMPLTTDAPPAVVLPARSERGPQARALPLLSRSRCSSSCRSSGR